MDVEEKLKLIKRNTVEIVTESELRERLERGEKLKGYIGFEPSGLFHVGWLIWAKKVDDLVKAGIDMRILAATWHAWVNDKLGGDLNLIRDAAKYTWHVLKALGLPMEKIKWVYAEDLVNDDKYWALVLRVAKNTSLARMKRALTIMGRKTEEAELDSSKLIYPAMQVSDIIYMDLDVALGGLDQRKAHMLQRDVAPKLKAKKVIAIHTPLLTSLQGGKRMDVKEVDDYLAEVKMSKSKPETAIFVHDSEEEIWRKIKKAYCPAKVVELNPVIDIVKFIIFPWLEGRSFIVERPERFGGTVAYEKYDELERDFKEGKLHPLDLKKAAAKYLAEILKPVREYFEREREAKELYDRLKKAKISR